MVRVENHAQARVFLFLFQELPEALHVGLGVALYRAYRVGHDRVVVEVHVERQLPVSPSRPERRHVADYDLHGPRDGQIGQQ